MNFMHELPMHMFRKAIEMQTRNCSWKAKCRTEIGASATRNILYIKKKKNRWKTLQDGTWFSFQIDFHLPDGSENVFVVIAIDLAMCVSVSAGAGGRRPLWILLANWGNRDVCKFRL